MSPIRHERSVVHPRWLRVRWGWMTAVAFVMLCSASAFGSSWVAAVSALSWVRHRGLRARSRRRHRAVVLAAHRVLGDGEFHGADDGLDARAVRRCHVRVHGVVAITTVTLGGVTVWTHDRLSIEARRRTAPSRYRTTSAPSRTCRTPGLETVLVQAEGIYTTALRVAEPPTGTEGTEESQ